MANNNNRRLPKVTLEIFEPGEEDQTLRTSAWFITINTNRAAKTVGEYDRLKEGLDALLREMQDFDNLQNIVQFTNRLNVKGAARYVNDGRDYSTDTIESIESVDFRARIEKSPSTAPLNPNRVHIHIYVKIQHRSNIHLSQEEIKQLADTVLRPYGVTGVYVNIRTANTGTANITKYLGKPQL
jgi:hypothetical protein